MGKDLGVRWKEEMLRIFSAAVMSEKEKLHPLCSSDKSYAAWKIVLKRRNITSLFSLKDVIFVQQQYLAIGS